MPGMDLNPGAVEIQQPDFGANTPLFLLHDGGGTVFNYFLLADLDRPVYGIANSHFDSGEPWPGGMQSMVDEYAGYICSTVPSGPILLGGWSMGGMLSLALSYHLRASHTVKGIVMIDSPFPHTPFPPDLKLVKSDPEFSATTRPEVRAKILVSMQECRRVIAEWTLPQWTEGEAPPPAVLLKARDRTAAGEGSISSVDLRRDDAFLGWRSYPWGSFVKKSVDVQGAHFSLFRFAYIDGISKKIKEACDSLDR